MYNNMVWDDSVYGSVKSRFTSYGSKWASVAEALISEIESVMDFAEATISVPYAGPTIADVEAEKKIIDDAVTQALQDLESIKAAISDYSDGVWDSLENKSRLDEIFKNSSSGSSGNSSGSSGGGSSGGGASSESVVSTIPTNVVDDQLQLTPNEEIAIPTETESVVPSIISGDEEIILPENLASIATPNSVVGTSFSGESDDSILSSISSSDLASSASGSVGTGSSLLSPFFPSISGSSGVDGNVSNVKGAAVIGTVGVAAAAAALGGKSYFDSKKEKENDNLEDETAELDDNISEDENETEVFDPIKLKENIFKI